MAQVAPDRIRYLDRGKSAASTEKLVTIAANVPIIERNSSMNSVSESSQNRWVGMDGSGSPSRGVQLKDLKDMSPNDRLLLRDAQKLSVRRDMRRGGSFSSLSSSSKSSKRSAGTRVGGPPPVTIAPHPSMPPLVKSPSLIKMASGGLRQILGFSVAIAGRLKRSLQNNKKVKALITRLWRECVVSTYLHKNTWALEDYMDYHLSLYCFLEPRDHPGCSPESALADSIDVAWETAMEDWESDTEGRKALDFSTFFDSMFELCTCYADDRTAASYARFLTELVAGTTQKNPEAPNGKSWAFQHPATADKKGLDQAVHQLRSLVPDLASRADPEGGVPAWLTKFGGGRTLAHGPDAGSPMIAMPADLMAALLKSLDVVRDAGDARAEQRLKEVLEWISSDGQHECRDDASRGRLTSLYRALDAGKDGRISEADILAGGTALARANLNKLSRGAKFVAAIKQLSFKNAKKRASTAP